MGTMNISVDMDRVQTSVNAAIRPAVEKALSSVDVEAIILKTLMEKQAAPDRTAYLYAMIGRLETATRPLIESMVQEGVQEIAKEYVQGELMKQRGEIEEALRRMMTGSANRLVKAFGNATERALEEDWGFELDVKVSHKVKEKDSSSYDD